ncbi:interferon lambda-3-like [Leptodactylus fuscus]|uniref:interferon lambda-3-like n=1 Tax=Leptodactylus fuscus TaxID=238119 RepID=UPI003F4E9E71
MDIRLVVFCILLVAVTGRPHRRRCTMSKYKKVSADDITVIKKLQNEQETMMSSNAIRCYSMMMRHKQSVCDLEPSDRLLLTWNRVSITVDVLENMSASGALDSGSRSLMVFLRLRDDLMICKESSGFIETPSEHLKPWLHHLQKFMDEESPQCLQDAVILGLIQLLVEDVGCWAHGQ